MTITRQIVADQISAHLRGQRKLAEIVSWAEAAMQEGEFDQADLTVIRDVVSRLGVADVAAFGLTWEDAMDMLSRLGYRATIEIQALRT
jgi:acetyl-CoA acetyltransferase